MTQLIASRYRVIRELGRGGMGVVYLVEHVRTGDQLALKLLHGQSAVNAQAVERFKREARASARIKSEHVVKVVDADVAPELSGAPFLVMELLNGTDLQKQLEAHGRLPPEQAIHYLGQAARALDKSHQMGIVHRDLKPENLFIHHREDGTTVLKILDFGISKVIHDGAADMTGAGMTSTGAVMGTPLYMSPEQARGRVTEIGPTTDVWAMGLICIQLLSGEVYWRANTVPELMAQILSEPLYPPTQRWKWMPAAVDSWFARSCAREAAQRFPTVGQQIEALAVALGVRAPVSGPAATGLQAFASAAPFSSTAPAATPPTSTPAVRTTTGATSRGPSAGSSGRRSRAPLIIGATVAVLGAAGAAAWAVVGQRGSTSPPITATTIPSGAAATPPPAASSAAPSAPSESVASSAARIVPVASTAPPVAPEVSIATKAAPASPQRGRAQSPAATTVSPSPSAHSAAPATPTPSPTPHTFNPVAP